MLLLAGVDDLYIVRSAVSNLAGRWKDLGSSLGVHADDLDIIQSNNPLSSSDCLREMLLWWLRQSYTMYDVLQYLVFHPNLVPFYLYGDVCWVEMYARVRLLFVHPPSFFLLFPLTRWISLGNLHGEDL